MGCKNGTVVFTVILHLNCSRASAAHMPAPSIPPDPHFHLMEPLTLKKATAYSCLTFIVQVQAIWRPRNILGQKVDSD